MADEHVAEDQSTASLIPTDSTAAPRSRADTSADDVVLLDAADRPIGVMPKLEAHRRGCYHLAISVILRDSAGRFLVHQRAQGKYHSGGLWTNTCCSHPRPGESIPDAAARRLREEMGISTPLTPMFTTSYQAQVSATLIEHELVHVFGGLYEGAADPDPAEVADWRWIERDALNRDVEVRPEAYTVWFRKFLSLMR